MNVRRLNLALALLASATLAQAKEPQPYVVLDVTKIDVSKWCVYDNALYSRGAILEIKGRFFVCAQEAETGPGANRLAWRKE